MAKYLATTGDKFDALQIRLASPEEILKWSRGEVKKPETVNYRTHKPERDGLFCERIFGPTKDWECGCGKYKKVKHRGITCDRCGVEITEASVRRERMGCIKLAVPVTHIWFFKSTPSAIGNILDLSIRALEKIIYYENYVVIDPGETTLEKKQILTQDEYEEAVNEFGPEAFVAKMGGEAIKQLLLEVDLDQLFAELQEQSKNTTSQQNRAKALKRLKVVEAFRRSGNQPSWMVLDVIPVIPPDLRPLVPLDGGRYATSDLNDLYRRVINRNNRLKRLLDVRAPEVILRNEKRMLQEAVDALFDNGRHGRAVMGTAGRQLKSLTDALKGKQGRFRLNLLGKRVDYSGRSVIVVGPELKLHQCGLPKFMALELFEPFVIHQLKERGLVQTIKSAKRMLKSMVARGRAEVWDILEDVIRDHPVLLNRAPTLHRLGIQAFQPVLIEGKAIRLHPLVCAAFNADFDGDQMAVHVPLLPTAQMEAHLLMMSTSNIFSPANGSPIVSPSQDIVLGIAWLTKQRPGAKGEWQESYLGKHGVLLQPGKVFPDMNSVVAAYEAKEVDIHAAIKVWADGKIVDTTVGRVLFCDALPIEITLEDVNREHDKASIGEIIARCYRKHGHAKTVELLDALKRVGFKYATLSGLSIAMVDIVVPEDKPEIIERANREVAHINEQHEQGLISDGERYNKIVDLWKNIESELEAKMLSKMERNDQGFSGIYLMYKSGARGSKAQVRQLAAMRGVMAKPSGEIIETPIISNFREGLSVVEYFISSHGARKGLADTALKTADAGYLTRRLVDVAQDVVVTQHDCGTMRGVTVQPLVQGTQVHATLQERIVGRYSAEQIVIGGQVLLDINEEITDEIANRLVEAGVTRVQIRSVLVCEAKRGVCAKCYGRNLATGRPVELGEAVGVIAAQSIGEPGTQLTMRTFHIGGAASLQVENPVVRTPEAGTVEFYNLRWAVNKDKETIVLNRGAEIIIKDVKDRELHRVQVPAGAKLRVRDGEKVARNVELFERDPYNNLIIAESDGRIKLEGMVEGVTMRIDYNPQTGMPERVVTEHRAGYYPQVLILGEKGEILSYASVPPETHVLFGDGDFVTKGTVIAKTPRKLSKTQDITGGLPRVTELFEARPPKDPAIISEIEGTVEIQPGKRGAKMVRVVPPGIGQVKEYAIPPHKHLNVQSGDIVRAGQPLTDGAVPPQQVLDVLGEDALRQYLLDEIQMVYRLQGVRINDKHIEVIIRQMLRKMRILDPGDTPFLLHEEVDKARFEEVNRRVMEKGGRAAEAVGILQGITKAALSTESFIAAASFQFTTRVLTEAAIAGKRDYLRGLKENVIVGRLIPAGSGYPEYKDSRPVIQDKALADFTEELEITADTATGESV